MKSGALLAIVGTLGAGGYFGYDYWQTEKAKKKGKEDAAKAVADRYVGNSPTTSDPSRHAVPILMPSLLGLRPDAAKDVLIKAGFSLEKFRVLTDSDCPYANEKDMRPKGSICSQEPSPKISAMPNARLEVTIEKDTYEEGGVGSPSEWKRMPAVQGMTEAAARAMLRSKGFTDDEFSFAREQGCGGAIGTVCRTNPEGLERKIRGRVGTIYVAD